MAEEKKEETTENSDVVHAFYVVYNRKEDKYGVIGSPGFFDDKIRALGAIEDIKQQVIEYYVKQKRLDQRIITGAKNMVNRMNFRNFIKGK